MLAVAITAQGKPDFSGQWALITPKQPAADIAVSLSVQLTLTRTNVRGEPMAPYFSDITIERHAQTGTSAEYHQIGVIGGFVSGSDGSAGPRYSTHHAVTWRENALVFELGTHTAQGSDTDVWTERLETWSLNTDGHLLVVISTSSSRDVGSVTTLMYQRLSRHDAERPHPKPPSARLPSSPDGS